MAVKSETESAVRAYLMLLQKDGAKIGRARSQAKRASDPMVKLRALAVIDQARVVEEAFVNCVSEFSQAEGVTVEVWRKLGVPEQTLQRAGVTDSAAGGATASVPAPVAAKAAKKPARSRKPKKAARSTRLDLEAVAANMPRKQFKVREFAEAIDRPVPTARNYLDRLEAAKAVKVAGFDKSGRGKPAKIYQRV